MLWDGLVFFGFDDTKLERLNGKKPELIDKFKSTKWLLKTTILAILIVAVIMSSLSKLGTVKLQKIELTERNHFKHHARDVLTLHAVNHFQMTDLLKFVNNI